MANSIQQPTKTNLNIKTDSVIEKKQIQPLSKTYINKTKLTRWNTNLNNVYSIVDKDKLSKKKYAHIKRDIQRSDYLIKKVYRLQSESKSQRPKLLKAAADLEKYSERLEKALSELENDSEMMQINLQSANQQRQQMMTLITAMTKVMHDTNKAIIKNIK
ncbi:hypothetical protein GCM10023151_20340 [Kangiella marina]|uniref:Uncharacterized protein n=2 Tax=Kangiella marina TaxID=1079178 RepID=A0ABP8INF3_9GAMM